ncbi:MAG: hypothetical protein K6E84_00440 [Lachnospiraceae bacterium]|nr:hypothetical protein [Lachnospiraceae bacterium]
MPKMTKETLRALKQFADQVIAAGNINTPEMRRYFIEAARNTSYSEDARNDANEIYNIITNDHFQAFDKLSALSAKMQTMIDDPNYPDNSPTAEDDTRAVTDTFRDYYDNYRMLDTHIMNFNADTGYKPLNKLNSPLQSLIGVIHSYSQIDTQYDLINIQIENSYTQAQIDALKKENKKLDDMTDFIVFEVADDVDFHNVNDIIDKHHADERTLNATRAELADLKSPDKRLVYETLEKRRIEEAQQHQKNYVDAYKKVLDEADHEVQKAQELTDSARHDFDEYKNLEARTLPMIRRAAEAKQEHERMSKELQEMRRNRVKLNNLIDLTHIDKEPQSEADKLYKAYYKAKRNSEKWEQVGKLFEEFFEKYGNSDMAMAVCASPESNVAVTFKKVYQNNPNTKAQSDEINGSEKLLADIKKILPDPEFWEKNVAKAKNEQGVLDRKLLRETIEKETTQFAESSFYDLAKDQNYINHFRLKQINKLLLEATDKEDPRAIEMLQEEQKKLYDEMLNNGSGAVDLKHVDDILVLQKLVKDFDQLKLDFENAAKDYAEKQQGALTALNDLEKLKAGQLIKNNPGFARLREAVEKGELSKTSYDTVVSQAFKGNQIHKHYEDMTQKAEENLRQKKASRKAVSEQYRKLKRENTEMKLDAKDCSFNNYVYDVVKKAVSVHNHEKELEKNSGRYQHIQDTKLQFKTVEDSRRNLYVAFKEKAAKKQIAKGIYDKVNELKRSFTFARNNPNPDPKAGNSNKYNAIYTALESFGTKQDIEKLSPDELREKFRVLSKAASDYKTAKLNQKLHFKIFASKQRTFRLAYADEVTTFCKNETALLGNGWDITPENERYISDQAKLLPEGMRYMIDNPRGRDHVRDESVDVRFRRYTEKQADYNAVHYKVNQLKDMEADIKSRLNSIDLQRKGRKEIIMTDEENKRIYEQETWTVLYYLHTLDELHNYKAGETSEERWTRLTNMYEEYNEDANVAAFMANPPDQKYKDVANYINTTYSNPSALMREKVDTASMRSYLKAYGKTAVEKNTEKELYDRERQRLKAIEDEKKRIQEAAEKAKKDEPKYDKKGNRIPKPSAPHKDLTGPTGFQGPGKK